MGALIDFFGARVAEWRDTDLASLHFWQYDAAWIAAIIFLAVAFTIAIARTALRLRTHRDRVGLPAILARFQRPPLAFIRHTPLLLALAGLPLFLVALADPYTSLTQKRMTFPGRRICLMIDASSSMWRYFDAPTLLKNLKTATAQGGQPGQRWSEAAFFSTIAAADRFVRLRMESQYRDLMALVEFGDHAYVVTPFTNDYNNILLSLSLIGDFGEFFRFPDQGTIISTAVHQGVRLFKAFNFLDAAGNIMVMFTDGEDAGVIMGGQSVADVVAMAREAKVPVYLIRVNYNKQAGSVIPDAIWKDAVEQTGGRFYAAANEDTILRAIRDIDRAAVGKIDIKQYVTQRAKFAPFTFAAAALWTLALVLRFTVPYFRRFP